MSTRKLYQCSHCHNQTSVISGSIFAAINIIESEFYFMSALGIDDIPSEATLRQRMDEHAVVFLPIIEKAYQVFSKP
ncbi:MAG: hypothetical protein P8163_16360 [Candidatus Thiodiazotropha sp.]